MNKVKSATAQEELKTAEYKMRETARPKIIDILVRVRMNSIGSQEMKLDQLDEIKAMLSYYADDILDVIMPKRHSKTA